MKSSNRRYRRGAPVRHEAWIDRRSDRTSIVIREAKRKAASKLSRNESPATNDNAKQT